MNGIASPYQNTDSGSAIRVYKARNLQLNRFASTEIAPNLRCVTDHRELHEDAADSSENKSIPFTTASWRLQEKVVA